MGTAGDAYDNAMCESFFGTLEAELPGREHFATHEQAGRRIFCFLASWYNIRRLHSSIGYCSPLEFENLHANNQTSSSSGCPPAGSVMVVTGDPLPARGQPATQRLKEDQYRTDPTANLSVEAGQAQAWENSQSGYHCLPELGPQVAQIKYRVSC
jgi:hypothetical protein